VSTQERIIIGYISGVYGLKGWVKVFSYTNPTANILTYSSWQLYQQDQWHTVTIAESRSQEKKIVVRLEGYTDRDDTVALLGAKIAVEAQQLPQLPEGEYYWKDLLGLTVINLENVSLGVVDYLFETGANDVIVVKGEREHLIPFVRGHVVVAVDLIQKVIKVDWGADF
jgi:16S rRNA processing protein RimM